MKVRELMEHLAEADPEAEVITDVWNGRVFSTDSSSVKDIKTARMHPYPQIWTYHGTIDDLYLQIQIERMINATLVTPVHFTGFEKQETSNGPEYLFYGSNCINYYRDVHENMISSYYKNIPDIKTCHDRIGIESGGGKLRLQRLTVPKNLGVRATV